MCRCLHRRARKRISRPGFRALPASCEILLIFIHPRSSALASLELLLFAAFICFIRALLAFITSLVMSRTAAQIPDFTGRVIDNGRYKLVSVLGAGAYGVVYRALDLSSAGSPVERAVKILDKRNLSDAAARRVRREIVLHHVVSEHPNVVTMHLAFEDAMFVYLVLDYCPGGDLFARIADDKCFFRNDELSKAVFLKILDGVAHCHQQRVFHRDLKPENILCSEDGSQVYVSDFGLCTAGLVSQTFGCGSSPYMSPGMSLCRPLQTPSLADQSASRSAPQSVSARRWASCPTPTERTTSGLWASSS